MKKAIIFDLDGTVVNSPSQKLPTKALIDATQALRKKYFLCAATGRSWSFAKIILKALQLTDPCIISGGTTICDPTSGKLLWQKLIDKAALKATIRIMRQYPKYKLIYNDYTEQDYLKGGISPKAFKTSQAVYLLEQIFVPDKVALEIAKRLADIAGIACTVVVAQKKGFRDLHISNKQATKEHSIEVLLSRLKVDKQDTIGIGDGYNDLHLFASVNYKVAMGNSVGELKAAADEVIGRVEDDGLVDYFRKLAK